MRRDSQLCCRAARPGASKIAQRFKKLGHRQTDRDRQTASETGLIYLYRWNSERKLQMTIIAIIYVLADPALPRQYRGHGT